MRTPHGSSPVAGAPCCPSWRSERSASVSRSGPRPARAPPASRRFPMAGARAATAGRRRLAVGADQQPADPFHGQGLAPDAFVDAAVTWHALQQLGPIEAARAVAALDPDDLRRLVLTSLLFRGSGFRLSIEDGALTVRSDDLDAEAWGDIR